MIVSTNNSNNADGRIENMNNNQNNDQNDHSQTDELLYWLQEFHATKILPLNLDLMKDIRDEDIEDWDRISGKISITPGTILIYILGNPGWDLNFNYQKVMYENQILIDLGNIKSGDWIYLHAIEPKIRISGGTLYLSIILHSFECWIEGKNHLLTNENFVKSRTNLKVNNKLLCWLEEFYHSNIIDEYLSEQDFGFSLVNTQHGWIMICSLSNRKDLELKDFDEITIREIEGQIRCYKIYGLFIIRAHPRGLIKGIQIFKDWILF